MANNNTFSVFQIPVKDATITGERMEAIHRLFDDDDDNVSLSVELFGAKATSIAAALDARQADGSGLGFEWSVMGGDSPSLVLFHDESIEMEAAVAVAQIILDLEDDNAVYSAMWADVCSAPRIGEFGGGAVAFNRWRSEWRTSYQAVRELEKELEAKPRFMAVGTRVFWTDPGDGLASGWGTVTVAAESEDSVVHVALEDGGEAEVLDHELDTIGPAPHARETFASVVWDIEDVKTIRPSMTDDQARAFLLDTQNQMRDRLIELGWDVMDTLLDMEGYKKTDDDEDEDEDDENDESDRRSVDDLTEEEKAQRLATVDAGQLPQAIATKDSEWAEDVCEVCGVHIGFGIRLFHLGLCDTCEPKEEE